MTPDEVEETLSRATSPYCVVFNNGEEWLLSGFFVSGEDLEGARNWS